MRYMLDTNAISHLLRRQPTFIERMSSLPPSSVCISAITEAELLFGLARRPQATTLNSIIEQVLRHIDVLPWNRAVASHYGLRRAQMESRGLVLGSLDMLIAAHALAIEAVLVTSDRAFSMVEGLDCEDWTTAPSD